MQLQTHLLNPKGLLAAMVAMAMSGAALAETAGRVNFVVGNVVAVGADGKSRTLSKGDTLNSGERIETGTGRVQIRFTDGSFLALQPDTVFGLDQYTYSRAKPEEGSLLFNFLRGSMRTVSGAIGKVNRANYKVKTPVATIGIRGTGYAGRIHNGTLLLSVSHGMVNISNDLGSSNVNAGQTFITRQGEAPQPAPPNETAGARADQPQGKGEASEEKQENTEQTGQQESVTTLASDTGSTKTTVSVGEQVDQSGNNVVDATNRPSYFTDSDPKTKTPGYTLAAIGPVNQNAAFTGPIMGESALGTFEDGATDNNAVESLTDATGTQPLLANNNAKTVNLTNRGAISFGEWTDGTLSSLPGDSSTGSLTPVTLDKNTFVPYIVGLSASQPLGRAQNGDFQRLTYSHDAGIVRSGSDIGTINTLNLTITLDQVATAALDLQVTMKDGAYGASGVNLGEFGGRNGLLSSLSNTNFTVSGADCQQGCSASLAAFFAGTGSEMGALFQIHRTTLGDINGVDRLVQSKQETLNLTPSYFTSSDPVSKTPTYTIATLAPVNQNTATSLILADSSLGQFSGGSASTNNAVQQIADAASGTVLLKAGTAQTARLTNTGSLSYGEWTNGTLDVIPPASAVAAVTSPTLTTVTLGNTTFVPYIVGYETAKNVGYINNGSGAVTMSYALDKGIVRSGAEIGTLNTFNINVTLAPDAFADVDMAITMSDGVYQAFGAGIALENAGQPVYGFSSRGLFGLTGPKCSQGGPGSCSLDLTGFFSSQGSYDQIGALFEITRSGAANITGAASLTNTGTSTTGLYVPGGSGYSGLFMETQGAPLVNRTLVDDQEVGTLNSVAFRSFSGGDGGFNNATATTGNFGAGAAQAQLTESQHYKETLSWGKWSSGQAVVANTTYSLAAADGASMAYLVGIPAAAAPTSAAGSGRYYFVGGTSPTAPTGTTTGSTVTGSMSAASSFIDLTFAPNATATLQLAMNISGQSVVANGAAVPVLAPTFGWDTLSVAGCTANCGGAAAGFFAGPNSSMAALKYSVDARGVLSNLTGTINGVAAFDRNPPVAN